MIVSSTLCKQIVAPLRGIDETTAETLRAAAFTIDNRVVPSLRQRPGAEAAIADVREGAANLRNMATVAEQDVERFAGSRGYLGFVPYHEGQLHSLARQLEALGF